MQYNLGISQLVGQLNDFPLTRAPIVLVKACEYVVKNSFHRNEKRDIAGLKTKLYLLKAYMELCRSGHLSFKMINEYMGYILSPFWNGCKTISL